MFYPVDSLRKGGRFYLCWIADSWPLRFEQFTHRNQRLWSQDIREICDQLQKVMNEESGRSSRRFSLRLSSQLIRGLARLYQKKVEVFIRDVMTISIKVRSPKTSLLERPAVPRRRRPAAAGAHAQPTLVIEELPPDEVNLEQIQENSRDMIARVEDITLREPILQEIRLIDDGFGELNRDPVEMMLAHEVSMMQQSALDLPLEVSTEKSHDKSRLAPHDAAQLERISEHDVSLFRKSAVEVPTLTDFEKEIPDISDIPPPVLPAPEPQKQVVEQPVEEPRIEELPRDQPATEPPQQNEPQEMVLEELEDEPPRKKIRRLRNKLIIDKSIKLDKSYMRERFADNEVELRCKSAREDVVDTKPRVHVDMLLSRPASKFGNKLGSMFGRGLAGRLGRPLQADRHVEEVLSRRSVYQEPINEMIIEPVADKAIQELTAPVMQDISNVDRSARNVQEEVDISDLPTQKLSTVSQEERATQLGETQKRRRSQRMPSLHISTAVADKENIPGAANIQETIPGTPTIIQTEEEAHLEYITSMLQEAGLAEQPPKPPSIAPTPTQRDSRTIRHSESSETPLGSLDRTKVSLGDSERTTDSKRFLDEHWGVLGTMIKIFKYTVRRISPITVETMVSKGPVMESRERITAARCFTSILNLQKQEFIKVTKDEETYAIINIQLGPRITNHPRLKLYLSKNGV
ncbi:uncharacterized protein LOC123869687 [Maniola jurtina]|uniref:uncharacterized protein LOC123869687 n=1 Tax=Maniola jurtina TaxID=191418 RepID=UPI001E68D55F|nr:uncharacterized protein LOC123869687 [Maniola jurtina]